MDEDEVEWKEDRLIDTPKDEREFFAWDNPDEIL